MEPARVGTAVVRGIRAHQGPIKLRRKFGDLTVADLQDASPEIPDVGRRLSWWKWIPRLNFMCLMIGQYGKKNDFLEHEGDLTLTQLADYSDDQFRQLVDAGYRHAAEPVTDGMLSATAEMFDPPRNVGPNLSMQSHREIERAFVTHGIGFRADTRSPDEVRKTGLKGKWSVPGLAGYAETRETVVATGMFLNRANRDFLNETGVCVARSMYGATKFPDPGHTDPAYLYAVRVKGKRGYDTEQYQLNKLADGDQRALWRPGEKAYAEIPKEDVIAARQFIKRRFDPAAEASTDVYFEYSLLSEWDFYSYSPQEKAYVMKHGETSGWLDFLRGDDFRVPG